MTPKLSKELVDAVAGRDHIEAVDPQTGVKYVIMGRSVFELTQRQKVREAIQEGVKGVEDGKAMTLEESKERTEAALDKLRYRAAPWRC